MSDSPLTDAEHGVQPAFRLTALIGAILLLVVIDHLFEWMRSRPDRTELGPRVARLDFHRVALDAKRFGRLRLVGAWRVTSNDPRFGGISALALDRGKLLALSDSGVLVRFAPPRGQSGMAEMRELPDGPGAGKVKTERDTEALLRDPQGRGWWVSFETRNQLWLFDRDFTHSLRAIVLGRRWKENQGIEGLAPGRGGTLLLFPEAGPSLWLLRDGQARQSPLDNKHGRIADAASNGGSGAMVVERRLSLTGFHSSVASLKSTATGYRLAGHVPLPLGPLDVVEGLAVQRLPSGTRRLWLMTDDNLQRPFRTLLVAFDLPPLPRR